MYVEGFLASGLARDPGGDGVLSVVESRDGG